MIIVFTIILEGGSDITSTEWWFTACLIVCMFAQIVSQQYPHQAELSNTRFFSRNYLPTFIFSTIKRIIPFLLVDLQ